MSRTRLTEREPLQHDWPDGLRAYVDAIRQGKGEHPKQYSAR